VSALCQAAAEAAPALAGAAGARKDAVLLSLGELLAASQEALLAVNAEDVELAAKAGMAAPLLQRLSLTPELIQEMIEGLRALAELPDPVGAIDGFQLRPNGLRVGRMRIPLGVIGFIYESRPNVTVDAAALCLKSGNAVVLKGGKEAFNSNMLLADLIAQALRAHDLPPAAARVMPFTQRAATYALLKQDRFLDVVIPRGGPELIRLAAENAAMPVLKHDKGVCHIYIDQGADLGMAAAICHNAKVQKPAACNALETILLHREEAAAALPLLDKALAQVEIRGCPRCRQFIPRALPAAEADWQAEYLDLIVALKVVDDMDSALEHIRRYSSRHTEAIISRDYQRCRRFLREVDSSVALVNASTRFNDGGQLGLGAEIGISTSKLHAFGPMGLEELTTRKFVVLGEGQTR
jgi:glutamate-5-semialdehyde dehydrogenase